MKIKIHMFYNKQHQTVEIQVQQNTTVRSIREGIRRYSQIPLDKFVLDYKDNRLVDDKTIGFYKIEPNSTIEVKISPGHLWAQCEAEAKLKRETPVELQEEYTKPKLATPSESYTIHKGTLAASISAVVVGSIGIAMIVVGSLPEEVIAKDLPLFSHTYYISNITPDIATIGYLVIAASVITIVCCLAVEHYRDANLVRGV